MSSSSSSSTLSVSTTQENLKSIIFVDTIEKLQQVLPTLSRQKVWAIDLEGVDLGATGEICIIQISTGRYSPVILLDVHTLGNATFTTPFTEPPLQTLDQTKNNTVITTSTTTKESSNTESLSNNSSSSSSSSSTTTSTNTEAFVNTNTTHCTIPTSLITSNISSSSPIYTLKQLLEDTSICKFMWDVRADTNALYGLFGVGIRSAVDLQVSKKYKR